MLRKFKQYKKGQAVYRTEPKKHNYKQMNVSPREQMKNNRKSIAIDKFRLTNTCTFFFLVLFVQFYFFKNKFRFFYSCTLLHVHYIRWNYFKYKKDFDVALFLLFFFIKFSLFCFSFLIHNIL